MQTEHLLYGLAHDESREYMETLLLVTKDQEQIRRVIEIASQQGWHSFRTATYNGEAPNFVTTVNI